LYQCYEITLNSLRESKNGRLYFRILLKLGKVYFEQGEFLKLSEILRALHGACKREGVGNGDGSDDPKKAVQLVETYALEMQMHVAMGNKIRLKCAYQKLLTVKVGALHPLILGVLRECGGKMYFGDGDWENSYLLFSEAFQHFHDAGSSRSIQCLKYLFLVNMLGYPLFRNNPLDLPGAILYQNTPTVETMQNILKLYSNNASIELVRALCEHGDIIATYDDSYFKMHFERFMKKTLLKTIQLFIRPYTRVHFATICQELNIPAAKVEPLLVSLILDMKISARIEQSNQLLLIEDVYYV